MLVIGRLESKFIKFESKKKTDDKRSPATVELDFGCVGTTGDGNETLSSL